MEVIKKSWGDYGKKNEISWWILRFRACFFILVGYNSTHTLSEVLIFDIVKAPEGQYGALASGSS